jgi:NAD(P)-dependent dehydrogenase (short-subunit alcohol dehydrogenase family)
MSLEGKVAAVTGASSGAGEEAALGLAARGATVVLGARRREVLEALARRIEDEGGRAVAMPVDVGDERQARAFVEHVYEAFGRLDVLVCAASACAGARLEGGDTEAWRRMARVSLLGTVYCCHAALPVMRAQGFGEIVCRPGAGEGMARGALVAFADALREEVAPLGISVRVD